jgi:hypothetical protein
MALLLAVVSKLTTIPEQSTLEHMIHWKKIPVDE